MTTSFTRTREQLARMVLRKFQVLGRGESDVSADMEIIYEAIDLRLKEMHRLGTFWRKVDKVPLTFALTANVNSASATAGILFPIAMTVVDSSRDEPVSIVGITEWAAIPDKTETGVPTKALWKGGAEFLFHPITTTARNAKLTYEKLADDSSAGAAPDVEVSMLRWLKDVIAYDVGDDFAQSEPKMVRLRGEAAVAERNIRMLGAQRKVELTAVAVDDWGGNDNTETDYGYRS